MEREAGNLMSNTNKPVTTTVKVKAKKKRSQMQEVWARLRKNKMAIAGLAMLVILIFIAIFANFIVDYKDVAIKQNLSIRLQGPSAQHWFGTDAYGRDILARIIYGARISLFFGITATVLSLIAGGIIGCISGYFGGLLDNVIMRIMDVFMAIPYILLAIALVSALGTGIANLMLAMIITAIPGIARLFRALVISIRGQEFIEASKAIGAGNTRIILRHIIPNTIGPVIVQATLGVCEMILAIASLSFLGLGVQSPTPEWGGMLSEGRQYIRHTPHLILFPGLAILLTVLSLNLLGDGLNDALDPKLKNS